MVTLLVNNEDKIVISVKIKIDTLYPSYF